jgi:Ca-activated chloride channel family protein
MRNLIQGLMLALMIAFAARAAHAQTPPPAPTPRAPVLQGVKRVDEKTAPARPDDKLPREVGEDEVLTVSTSLVSIPVSVVDGAGNYVTDLKQGDFRVYEDGVEQRVAVFSEISQPTFVVLLLDVSISVTPRLRQIQDAAIAFTDQLRASDYVYPVAFSGNLTPLLPQATNDRAALRDAIRRTRPADDNGTSIYDAVQSVSDEILKRFHGRKALILFTDGEDVSSRRAKKKDNLRDALELDALIYTVQYMWRGHQEYLRQLAENTGGKYFKGDKPQKLAQALTSIAEELRRQYIVGYYPSAPVQSGQSRKVKVVVNRPGMSARTRKTLIDIR